MTQSGTPERGREPGRLHRSAAELLFKSPLYRRSLKGQHPIQLTLKLDDPWPGEAKLADAMFHGRYRFAGQELTLPNQPPWQAAGASPPWLEALHGFAWIRHFSAAGGEAAERQARALVGSWLTYCSQWDPLVWRPDLVGRRLISWLGQGRLLLDDAEPTYRSGMLQSMAHQARHLARASVFAEAGPPRLTAAIGLIMSGLCLPEGDKRLERGLKALDLELAGQVLADGGHIDRNPSTHHQVLRDLITVRAGLDADRREIPTGLQNAIDRMAPMVRFFRHGDRGLALFNGGFEDAADALDLTLAKADAKGKAPESAPDSGFERLACGRTLVLIDVGCAAADGAPGHAGPLSFELSDGRERLIVNCGAALPATSDWGRAMAATAAHSTLTLSDRNSVEIGDDGRLANRPARVTCSRKEADGRIWLEAEHDGYRPTFGVVHRRRLYIDETGEDIRGEDQVLAADPRKSDGLRFAVRFHLHPAVQASSVQDGSAVLLRTAASRGWRLRAGGGAVGLEESVYQGAPGARRRSEQIVISGVCEGSESTVKWALARLKG